MPNDKIVLEVKAGDTPIKLATKFCELKNYNRMLI